VIYVLSDLRGIPHSTRSGAAVFHNRGPMTQYLKYGYGRDLSHSVVKVTIRKDTGEWLWDGTLQDFLKNTELFGK
jgi:hypothetical protein